METCHDAMPSARGSLIHKVAPTLCLLTGQETFTLANACSGAGAHFNHAARSYSVAQPGHAFGPSTMLAAEKCAFLFEPVADNMNTAISADRSKRMDRALKTVEG